MSAKSNSEAVEPINKRVAESFDELRTQLQDVAKKTDNVHQMFAEPSKPKSTAGRKQAAAAAE